MPGQAPKAGAPPAAQYLPSPMLRTRLAVLHTAMLGDSAGATPRSVSVEYRRT